MSLITIKDMRGMNANGAALQLPLGEAENLQNIRGRPYKNWAKRTGVATSLTQETPIMGIFDFEFDNITIPVYQAGGTLYFFPTVPILAPFSNPDDGVFPTANDFPINPSPYPTDPIDSGATQTVLFLIEPSMRAAQERAGRINTGWFDYPNRFFNSDGSLITPAFTPPLGGEAPATQTRATYNTAGVGSSTFPVNNFYKNDLYWYDVHFANPTGTYAAYLVNLVVAHVDANTSSNKYSKINSDYSVKLEGETATTWFDSTTLWGGALPVATSATYRSVLTYVKMAIRKLKFVLAFGGQASSEIRTPESGSGSASCADAVASYALAWSGGSWSSTVADIQSVAKSYFWGGFPVGSQYQAGGRSVRGKITADLSAYTSGNATLYLWPTSNSGTRTLSPLNPTAAGLDKWGAMNGGASYSVGSAVTSDYVPNSDLAQHFLTTCAVSPGIFVEEDGWILSAASGLSAGEVFAVNFIFNYNV